jgi:L-lactate utilization protein LutC
MGEENKGNSFLSKFMSVLGGKPTPDKEETVQQKSSFAPKAKEPVDLAFVKRFTDSGGKFLYCENADEIYDYLAKIAEEANISRVYCKDASLQSVLAKANLPYSTEDYKESEAFCCACEYLISFVGGIMISENQTKGVKLDQLPEVFITVAYTSQIVENLRAGLTGIRQKYQTIPGQITTIKGPRDTEGLDLAGATSTCQKNIYLILVEDQM